MCNFPFKENNPFFSFSSRRFLFKERDWNVRGIEFLILLLGKLMFHSSRSLCLSIPHHLLSGKQMEVLPQKLFLFCCLINEPLKWDQTTQEEIVKRYFIFLFCPAVKIPHLLKHLIFCLAVLMALRCATVGAVNPLILVNFLTESERGWEQHSWVAWKYRRSCSACQIFLSLELNRFSFGKSTCKAL